jgi:hypothetical protein
MHQIVGIDLNNRHFPSSNYKEGEAQITKGCQTYGEAASTISIDQNISQIFELFFKGFTNPLWLPYLNNDNLTLPYEFNFENGCNDVRSIEILTSSSIHASCQKNSVEEGKIRAPLNIINQT